MTACTIQDVGFWTYIVNEWAIENKELVIQQQKEEYHGTLGKYMFFSDDKQSLIDLAKEILKTYDLWHAKVPLSDTARSDKWFGFVLCIYDYKNRYSKELAERTKEGIAYRHWKSDTATIKWEYSKQYTS